MDFLRRLAGADVFWSTAALAQVALMIALVLEGRTAASERFDLFEGAPPEADRTLGGPRADDRRRRPALAPPGGSPD